MQEPSDDGNTSPGGVTATDTRLSESPRSVYSSASDKKSLSASRSGGSSLMNSKKHGSEGTFAGDERNTVCDESKNSDKRETVCTLSCSECGKMLSFS
mmetsp:Transcript_31332/g.54289  ORF Transcript_31332/g.54289 Transcript_31332/m.54289 type:complete len:98 (+) Transcript_31332:290-583(+)